MKKSMMIAMSALALVGCQTDEVLDSHSGSEQSANTAIRFDGGAGKITRAQLDKDQAATALGNNFVVVGYKKSEISTPQTTVVFDHYNVNYKDDTAGSTTSNTANWEYVGQSMNVKGINKSLAPDNGAKVQTIKFWDNSCSSYDFIAFSLGKGYTADETISYATPSSIDIDKISSAAYTLNGDANTLSECYISDIKTVKKGDKGYANTAVQMSFRHLTSKVRIALYETVPGYVISDVKFHTSSIDKDQKEAGQLYGLFNEKGTYTVYFPKTGASNEEDADYNQAHVRFSKDETSDNATSDVKEFGSVNYNNEGENQIEAGSTYLSQNASNPSYCGTKDNNYYQTVLPAEDKGYSVTIRIDYTLKATDGTNETITVKNATATVPAEYTRWKPGYAYTYKFKISQNTNGTTGNEGDDTGLTAISFDAVVADDEATGQETITTVSTPSITTYGFNGNDVVANQNEYTTGTDIYATVYVPAKGTEGAEGYEKETTAAPQKLYTITIGKDAAQSINEASVANAIANGGIADYNGKKLTAAEVTSGTTIVKEVPTKDGHNLNVNALKWTADDAGTIYAVEYESGNTKTYKIIMIGNATK